MVAMLNSLDSYVKNDERLKSSEAIIVSFTSIEMSG